MVDAKGKVVATFGVNGFDERRRKIALTSEYEIMRGDLVRVLVEESMKVDSEVGGSGGLVYEYGKCVEGLVQRGDVVEVVFGDGGRGTYDLVVAADG